MNNQYRFVTCLGVASAIKEETKQQEALAEAGRILLELIQEDKDAGTIDAEKILAGLKITGLLGALFLEDNEDSILELLIAVCEALEEGWPSTGLPSGKEANAYTEELYNRFVGEPHDDSEERPSD